MAHYFINNHAQVNGDHEVHAVGCARMPPDKRYLGSFVCVSAAMMEARKESWQSAGCTTCVRMLNSGYSPVDVARSGIHQRVRLR